MDYNLDLSSLSIREYRELLKSQNLLPGRRILWQDINDNFDAVELQGVSNVAELKTRLSSAQKLAVFAVATGISEDYLTILKREIGCLEQKPVLIASFPDIDETLVSEMNRRGIKSSKDYYELNNPDKDELFCLCDLVRINGIGAVAARAFFKAGYRSVADVAGAIAETILNNVSKVNEKEHYYNAKLGVKDMQFCIDFAKLLMKYSV